MEENTLQRFNCLTAEIDAAYHDAALRFGLNDSEMMVLYMLCGSGGACPLGDIPRLSGVSKQTVNSALRRLEREDAVYCRSCGGRRKLVCLTEQGSALCERTVRRLMRLESEIFAAWSQTEQQSYLSLTQRYLSAFKAGVKQF